MPGHAGLDGVLCCYDATRFYTPTKLLCAGFPVHASCMAASTDGKTLAVATADKATGDQAILLYGTAILEPLAQLPTARSGPITHIQLLPGKQHVIVATADGRLQAYSCASGRRVVDVAKTHKGGCQALVVDDSGTFLATGGSNGLVKVWGLHQLHQLGGRPGDVPLEVDAAVDRGSPATWGATPELSVLPCQALAGHPGAIHGLAFVGRELVISVGAQAAVCSWRFLGQGCNHGAGGATNTTTSTLVASLVSSGGQCHADQEAAQVPPGERQAQPDFRLEAESHAGMGPAPAAPVHWQESTSVPPDRLQQPERTASPIPRPRPADLHPAHQRPPSAPAALASPSALPTWDAEQSEPRSLPCSPRRSPRPNRPPACADVQPSQERAFLISSSHKGERQVQPVGVERCLEITAASGDGKQPRSVRWVAQQVPGPPHYQPAAQFQLAPPSATLRHVMGFTAAAGFTWQPANGSIAYAAGNMLLLTQWGSGAQQHMAQLPGPITAMAATLDGKLLAGAAAPAADGSGADIHLFYTGRESGKSMLAFHTCSVQVRRERLQEGQLRSCLH